MDVNAQLNNIVGLQNVLELSKLISASTFVFAGSMEESFSSSYQSYFLENSNYLYNRHIVYATVKQMAREYLELFTKECNFSIKIFTNSHLMGIGDDKDSFLQFLLEQMIMKPYTAINTSSGEQLFDVISVKDAARAYEFLWQIKEPDNSIRNYCIGSSAPRPLKEYVVEAASICEFSLENIRFGALDFNDVSLSKDVFLPSLASKGFVYNYDFASIVTEMKTFYLTNRNWNQ
jgi:nucleoside-diphosphate-sugar epimerase